MIDARSEFERKFPVPEGVIRCGDGYAPTDFNADQGYDRMWKVWQTASARIAELEDHIKCISMDRTMLIRALEDCVQTLPDEDKGNRLLAAINHQELINKMSSYEV